MVDKQIGYRLGLCTGDIPPLRGYITRLCTKRTVANTVASRRAKPSRKSFSRACRNACLSDGVLLQPAEHSLDDVALHLFGPVEQARQPRFGLMFHGSQRDHGLHPIAVTVLAQGFGIVALVSE